MKKLIMFLLILTPLLMTSCNSTKPCSQAVVVNTVANAAASAWKCSNPAALTAWFDGFASKVGLCTTVNAQQAKAGPIASLACPLLVSALQSAASQAVPAAAGCTAVGNNAAAALTSLCSAIPF